MPQQKNHLFVMSSDFLPAGDQPLAISELTAGIKNGIHNQVLLGVTGSGKTFTMASVIKKIGKPTLIMAPNKILAAQLYGEMKDFFPQNAVEYFVSYYDYYQPEAYVPKTDTYIEKDSSINEQIDRMRHSATRSLLERRDVIIVASVSCLYGLGSVESYSAMTFSLEINQALSPQKTAKKLTEMQYERNDLYLSRSTFRIKGDVMEIFPCHYEDRAWRISFFGDDVEKISEFDPLTGKKTADLEKITIYPASHYVTPAPTLNQAIKKIKIELQERLLELKQANRLLEYQRLLEKTNLDLEMLESTGHCKGIENYSRHLTGRKAGEPPPTLFEYLPSDALLFIDESHVTTPQIRAMYKGDYSRKKTLADYGFRLPSCVDNRPLNFEEWNKYRPQTIFVSATPSDFELEQSQGVFVEQVIRPTGLLDPICLVRPTENQVDDLMNECQKCAEKKQRVLVTTLTKKMAENLTEYLFEHNLKVRYMHSDIETIERIEIMRDLRLGVFDILVGINLLREGLDVPECALVAILDADKEGFLRSARSLIQTIGRSARNANGRVILYADKITNSMQIAMEETARRREKQQKYNAENGITPTTITNKIRDIIGEICEKDYVEPEKILITKKNAAKTIKELESKMFDYASNLEFELAAKIRDEIKLIEKNKLGINQ